MSLYTSLVITDYIQIQLHLREIANLTIQQMDNPVFGANFFIFQSPLKTSMLHTGQNIKRKNAALNTKIFFLKKILFELKESHMKIYYLEIIKIYLEKMECYHIKPTIDCSDFLIWHYFFCQIIRIIFLIIFTLLFHQTIVEFLINLECLSAYLVEVLLFN